MPTYAFLAQKPIDWTAIQGHLEANRTLGVPYTKDMIASARADFEAQADPNADGQDALLKRYPKAQIRDFDGNADQITEMDALISYLQMLGTTVDFSTYQANSPDNQR
jgi:cytochrome c oxidase cbb3-type subunit 2